MCKHQKRVECLQRVVRASAISLSVSCVHACGCVRACARHNLPSSDHPDGDGLLQLPGRGVDDITAHLDSLAAHSSLVEDEHLNTHTHVMSVLNIHSPHWKLKSTVQTVSQTQDLECLEFVC